MNHFLTGAVKRVFIFALAICYSSSAIAQDSPRESLNRMGQALSRVVVKAKKVTGKLNYGFNEGNCVWGAVLRAGSSASETFSLKAGQSYLFIGGGDKTARNVDIVIRDARGRVVGQDIEADTVPFVLFQPKNSGNYTMSLNLKSGWKGEAFCAVTLLRKGGADLPLESIVQTAIRMDHAAGKILSDSDGGRFNRDSNAWALYGAVLRRGQSTSSKPKNYRAARRGFVAVGDSSIKILDLTLLDANRKVVAKNKNIGAIAEIIHETGHGKYSIVATNRGSSATALLMTALLEIPAKKSQASSLSNANLVLPENSPFTGKWAGTWTGEEQGKENSFKMNVKPNGTLTGRFSNQKLNTSAKFTGLIATDGTITINYKKSIQDYIAEGRIELVGDEQKIEGRLVFSTLGVNFGTATFSLVNDE